MSDADAAGSLGAPEAAAMRRAIELSGSVGEATRPNPNVGAVVLDSAGHVVGEGRHERAGGPHAEVVALAAAGDRARGGTVVVTLEPCAHAGRTGPCTAALLAAGVARVVFAVPEPTAPAGGGAEVLRAAGVATVPLGDGQLRAEAEAANERWLTGARLRRPFVAWKVAQTLDGRVAAADGTSRWITSEASRADAHRLRAEVDAVLVGVGTVLADDPALTARDADGRLLDGQPLRVVADTHGRTPRAARVRDGAAPTWVATSGEVSAGAEGRLDPAALLAALHGRGVRYVLLEGGPTLAGSLVRAGLVDRVIAYVAPALLGAGRASLVGTGIGTLDDAAGLDVVTVRRCGPDVKIVARPAAPRSARR